jgi:sugar transferase (PEP-CTERM/EpsH1 system associated)
MPKPNILYLTHRVPYPPDKGDRIRNFHILRSLAQVASVHLLSLLDEPVAPETIAVLNKLCKRVCLVPVSTTGRRLRGLRTLLSGKSITQGAFHSGAVRRTVETWKSRTRFHAALASASSMAPYLEPVRDVPAYVDLMDVDSEKWLAYSRTRPWPLSWLFKLEARRMRELEDSLAYWTHGLIFTTTAEADIYRSFTPVRNVHAITNGVDLDYYQPGPADGPEAGCVFIGALDYYPNVDAAVWFGREVWPEIRRRRPEARWTLVGRRPVKAIRRLAQETAGVSLAADVPDVRVYLRQSAAVVVPLRIARGVQNKLLEALAAGKAVIASPQALAGVNARPGHDLLCASSPEDWAEATVRALDDATLRRRLGGNARRFVEEHHDWERCLEPLRRLLILEPGVPAEMVRHAVTAPRIHDVSEVPSFSI